MSTLLSIECCVEDIPHAGRGVIARKVIPKGCLVLRASQPATHVIFRQYRKEACARCFHYDRGRTLSVRDTDAGKVFCSELCHRKWLQDVGELGRAAWIALERSLKTKAKKSASVYSVDYMGQRPSEADVQQAWRAVSDDVKCKATRMERRAVKGADSRPEWPTSLNPKSTPNGDPDLMSFFLSGALYKLANPIQWSTDIMCLSMDVRPYRSYEDLAAHCSSFSQLHGVLSESDTFRDLLRELSGQMCHSIVSASSHNAFGLHGGSNDGEEYMGYALYPSASYLNHSCSPNVRKKRVGSAWEFTAARDIGAGEELCITYLGGDERSMSLLERSKRLEEVWAFKCMCIKCVRESNCE